jgi:hypothetical protein
MFDISDSAKLQKNENELRELEQSEKELAEQISQTWQPFVDIIIALANKLSYDQLHEDIGKGVLRQLANGKNWKHGVYLSHLRPVYKNGSITIALDSRCDIFIFETRRIFFRYFTEKRQSNGRIVQAYIKCQEITHSPNNFDMFGNPRRLLAFEIHLYNQFLTYYMDLFTAMKAKYLELVDAKKMALDVKIAQSQLLSGIKF